MEDYVRVRADGVRNTRKHMNMTQEKLARKLSVTQQALANYEKGRRKIPADLYARIVQLSGK